MVQLIVLLFAFVVTAKEIKNVNVPDEIQVFMDGYFQDTTSYYSFEKFGLKFNKADAPKKDCLFGCPLQQHRFDLDSLEILDVDAPVNAFLIPSEYWTLPVVCQCEVLYLIEVKIEAGKAVFCSMRGVSTEWKELDLCNNNLSRTPKVITYGKMQFLHFPDKGENNLYLLNRSSIKQPLSTLQQKGTPLSESPSIIRYLKDDPSLKKGREKSRQEWNAIKSTVRSQNKPKGGYND